MCASLWKAPDENRLAVSWSSDVKPVAGYVVRNHDDTWSSECGTTVRPDKYPSAKDAADAFLALANPGEPRYLMEAIDGKVINLGADSEPFTICVDSVQLLKDHNANVKGRLLDSREREFIFKNLPAMDLIPEFYDHFIAKLQNRIPLDSADPVEIDFSN